METIVQLEKKLENGDLSAALMLGKIYEWGLSGETDLSLARAMFRRCAKSSDRRIASQGHYELGLFYYYGLGVERDTEKAYRFFMKSVLVFPNHAALVKLGDMYRWGQYVAQNDSVSLSLYHEANKARLLR